jgi:hypothetical protein
MRNLIGKRKYPEIVIEREHYYRPSRMQERRLLVVLQ